jgi:hypothetical protein
VKNHNEIFKDFSAIAPLFGRGLISFTFTLPTPESWYFAAMPPS